LCKSTFIDSDAYKAQKTFISNTILFYILSFFSSINLNFASGASSGTSNSACSEYPSASSYDSFSDFWNSDLPFFSSEERAERAYQEQISTSTIQGSQIPINLQRLLQSKNAMRSPIQERQEELTRVLTQDILLPPDIDEEQRRNLTLLIVEARKKIYEPWSQNNFYFHNMFRQWRSWKILNGQSIDEKICQAEVQIMWQKVLVDWPFLQHIVHTNSTINENTDQILDVKARWIDELGFYQTNKRQRYYVDSSNNTQMLFLDFLFSSLVFNAIKEKNSRLVEQFEENRLLGLAHLKMEEEKSISKILKLQKESLPSSSFPTPLKKILTILSITVIYYLCNCRIGPNIQSSLDHINYAIERKD
jgi:hypothetical protein